MPRPNRTLLIDGYQPTKPAVAGGKVVNIPSGGMGHSSRSVGASTLTQKLPKTSSSVNIPKK